MSDEHADGAHRADRPARLSPVRRERDLTASPDETRRQLARRMGERHAADLLKAHVRDWEWERERVLRPRLCPRDRRPGDHVD